MPDNYPTIPFLWYLLSNLLICGLVHFTYRNPMQGRFGYAFLFFCASLTNSFVALTDPDAYLSYSGFAWGPYQGFILGAFKPIVEMFVLAIAAGQFLLAIFFLGKSTLLKVACIGSLVFFLAITPLGLGSAFPFPLIASLGCILIYRAARTQKRQQGEPRELEHIDRLIARIGM